MQVKSGGFDTFGAGAGIGGGVRIGEDVGIGISDILGTFFFFFFFSFFTAATLSSSPDSCNPSDSDIAKSAEGMGCCRNSQNRSQPASLSTSSNASGATTLGREHAGVVVGND